MSNKFKALDEIYSDLEKLKDIFSKPRLWIDNYFSEIKNAVDIEHAKYLMNPDETDLDSKQQDINELDFGEVQTLKKKSEDKQAELLRRVLNRYEKIIEKIENLEKNCYERLPTDKLDEEVVDKTRKLIEDIESRIIDVEASSQKDDADINYIDWLIHETVLQLQKHIMLNKSLFFITKNTLSSNDFGISLFGTLLVMNDEFISKRAIDTVQLVIFSVAIRHKTGKNFGYGQWRSVNKKKI